MIINTKRLLHVLLILVIALIIAYIFQMVFEIHRTLAFVLMTFFLLLTFYLTMMRMDQLKELERVVHFKNHTLDTLLKVSSIFMNIDEQEGHYEFILTAAIEVIPNAQKGSFLIYNPLTGRYEFKACHGYDLEGLQQVSFTLEETFLYQSAHGQYSKPVLIKNVAEYDSKFLDPTVTSDIEKAGGFNVMEAVSAPIVIEGKIIGILNIDSEHSDVFDETDLQLIEFFATQIGIALKQKSLVDETIQLTKFDKLTGAYNRNHFEKIFNAQRNRSLESMESYALILCDLDNLKVVNDSYGHSAGDQILMAFSQKIKSHIRDTDVFSRIGGDEFILLLRNINEEDAKIKMREIHQNFEDFKIDYNGHLLPVSFSYGVAISPDDSMVYDVLIKIADARMYAFKEKNKVDFICP